ncbi:MAG: hypothetical protein IKZ49_01730, partial [Alphaproteobacteria bacterium]|nr:hypothetical protein [Alphaproteobacteria bacterium]
MAGVYENEVNAVAEYENILYQIGEGQYLPAGGESVISCDQPGSFCPGVSGDVTYNANSAQGLTSCSTLGDGSYTLSSGTGSTNASCYKTCSASCTNPSAPAHSTNVSYGLETSNGTQHYGSTCNAVAPTCSISFDCVSGYHKRPNITIAQGVTLMKQIAQAQGTDITGVPDSYFEAEVIEGLDNWGAFWESLSSAEKVVFGSMISQIQGNQQPIFQPFVNMATEVITATNQNNEYTYLGYSYAKNLDGSEECRQLNNIFLGFSGPVINCNIAAQQDANIASFRQNAQNGNWIISIPDKNILVKGQSQCDYNETNQCRGSISNINGYNLSPFWYEAVDHPYYEQGECESDCAGSGISFSSRHAFVISAAKSGVSPQSLGFDPNINMNEYASIIVENSPVNYICDGNVITINWTDVDSEYAGQNNEGTARYGEDIRTPKAATIKPGQRFKGWRFVAPTPVQVGE